MILRRQGNKTRIHEQIIKYFPKHRYYVEPFFGAGGIFFNKPKVKYNLLNDIDEDIYNLYMVVMDDKEKLQKAWQELLLSQKLIKYWCKNQEQDRIKKAVRFLVLSNLTYMGTGNMLKLGLSNDIVQEKKDFNLLLDTTYKLLNDCTFANMDFRKFLKSITARRETEKQNAFIYADPPYVGTGNNYNANRFTIQDHEELIKLLVEFGSKFAVSEFDNNEIMEIAKKYNLNVIKIGERQNLKNRRTELLLTNYEMENKLWI